MKQIAYCYLLRTFQCFEVPTEQLGRKEMQMKTVEWRFITGRAYDAAMAWHTKRVKNCKERNCRTKQYQASKLIPSQKLLGRFSR